MSFISESLPNYSVLLVSRYLLPMEVNLTFSEGLPEQTGSRAMGWQCPESGVVQGELKKASQIPHPTTCCECVFPHLSQGYPRLALSTEAQEADYSGKSTPHSRVSVPIAQIRFGFPWGQWFYLSGSLSRSHKSLCHNFVNELLFFHCKETWLLTLPTC